ncbi:MAG: hypothetical protein JNL82_05965 [Myxococcales bacterium]|nr:hypothetical protein [Myxococcales bacterium]
MTSPPDQRRRGAPARGAAARLACALALLSPGFARAANGDLPRTPMQHLGEQCLTVVDRSVDPVVHLRWTIPFNDLCLTADELPDSRTHQLVAFCHGDPPARVLPHWHTRGDADVADAAGLADPSPIPASDILDEHPDYKDCWSPIVAADERRPISCAAARPGADWDTSSLPRGAYVVRGYTFEPPLNTWSPRRGLFKVVDGPDPADAPPAVGFAARDITYLWKNQPMDVRLCVDAMDGSTVTLAYAESTADPVWIEFVVDEPIASGDTTLEFLPPPALAGKFATLRAEIRDPMDRTFVAYLQPEIKVETVEDPNPPATTGDSDSATGDDGSTGGTGDAPYDFCADNPDADEPPMCPDPGTTGATGDVPQDEPTGGCCSVHGAASPAALLVLLALPRRRRRRREPAADLC